MRWAWLGAVWLLPGLALGQSVCPAAQFLPQLTIDRVTAPTVPVIDDWQILWSGVPMSDSQLALLARDDLSIEKTQAEMQTRGTWVYLGTVLVALGTAVSSAGWILYGQDDLPNSATLPIALGGLGMGVAGLLLVSDSLQTPLEPHLAPTPQHRLTREEARDLVARVNRRMFNEICEATEHAGKQGAAVVTTP